MDIWWCPCVEISLVLLEEDVCYDQCVLLVKLCYPFPCFILYSSRQTCLLVQISRPPTFAFQSNIMKRTSFCFLVLEVLVHLQKTIPLQLLQHYCSGHSPGLLCLSMVWLGNEQQSFCHFWDFMQALHFRPFWLIIMATPFLLRHSCSQ